MIQRIQSVWLFLASMACGLLFMPSVFLYRWATPGLPLNVNSLTATKFYPLLVLAAVMTLLPLIAIFFFRNRARQRGLAVLSLLACVAFLVVLFMKVSSITSNTVGIINSEYGILGAVAPVAGMIFLVLAIRGIKKDEKILRSLDRLR
jgi:hypothetical protein